MQLKTLTVAALLAVLPALAVPTADVSEFLADDGLVLLETFTTDDGVFTTYKADPVFEAANNNATTAEDASELSKRCGSNSITCDGSNAPALNTCETLVNSLRNSGRVLSSSPRSICLSRSGENCCVSWSKDVGSVQEAFLYNAAISSLNKCLREGKSAKAYDVAINGNCLNQCLSNRAKYC